jgi:hypothetical protein
LREGCRPFAPPSGLARRLRFAVFTGAIRRANKIMVLRGGNRNPPRGFNHLRGLEREMTAGDSSRRDLLGLAAIGAASAMALSSGEAVAYQGNMENALSALQAALDSLRAAVPNKGGHRERAIDLVERAMWQVQAGINFAAAHG